MSTVSNFLRLFSVRSVFRKSTGSAGCYNRQIRRNYADTPKPDSKTKSIVAQGSENVERVRVRRARVSDVPRVLRFVRENVRAALPSLASPHSAPQIVLSDYVHRALAQGHSMLAEQLESRRGWSQIRGLALSTALCPWDAAMLESWARCVRCTRSRRLMHFTAHCLRAPALHDKYRVHNILQVILIVPQQTPQASEIIHILAKNAIQRGREVGFPLVRFDVTNEYVSKSLEGLHLTKEWQLSYEVPAKQIQEKDLSETNKGAGGGSKRLHPMDGNYIAVYTAFTDSSSKT